jgi:hypothetical protein
MDLNFPRATGEEHQIELVSRIEIATWRTGCAIAGRRMPVEVLTAFVGEGATIRLIARDSSGQDLSTAEGAIYNNRFVGDLDIPADVEAGDTVHVHVELPDHGLDSDSNRIPVRVLRVTNLQWSESEARSGDELTLSADVEGVASETAALITIYEYDRDQDHDRLTEIETHVLDGRIEVRWEYAYHEDADEIPSQEEMAEYGGEYNPPEYFFTVTIAGVEFGREAQDSGRLAFRSWVDIRLLDPQGEPIPNVNYTLQLPNGEERSGTLDDAGEAREEDVPPGRCRVEFAPPDSGT